MLSLVGDPCVINPDSELQDHARANGWRIRDYRTGRKAARAGLLAAGAAGAASGALPRPWPSGVKCTEQWQTVWGTHRVGAAGDLLAVLAINP